MIMLFSIIAIESGGVKLIFQLELSEYKFLNLLNRGETILAAAQIVDQAQEGSPMMESMMRYTSKGFFSTSANTNS